MKKLIAFALLVCLCAGCASRVDPDLHIVRIPAGCNLDSITIKDNHVIDLKYHEREYWELSNCPRKLYMFQVEEKPWN